MTDDAEAAAKRLLAERGYTVEKKAEYVPPRHTCVMCGVMQNESRYPYPDMTDVTVEIAYGEEGHARITRYVCMVENPCLEEMQTALTNLGFKNHRHGGIDFLEDPDCPGYDKYDACPTPDKDEDDDD